MAIPATSALTSGVYTPTTTTVARTGNTALAGKAASLSSTAGIVATLGGSPGAQVYSPAGLLNTLAQAGTAAAAGSTGTNTGNGAGALANGGDWASILKANPSAAAFVIGASFTSGIIDTFA